MNWVDQLRSELERRKLPAPYVHRLVLELRDHLEDLGEDCEIEATSLANLVPLLGDPAAVASTAEQNYRSGYMTRHPLLSGIVYLLTPVVLLFLLVAGGICSMEASLKLFGCTEEILWKLLTPETMPLANIILPCLCIVGPSIVVICFYFYLGNWTRVAPKWPLMACIITALASGGSALSFECYAVPGDYEILEVDEGLELMQLIQIAASFVVMALLFRGDRFRAARPKQTTLARSMPEVALSR